MTIAAMDVEDLIEEWRSNTITEIENSLFDEEHADLLFVWEDGTKIPAHKLIVFKKCPYFKLVVDLISLL